MTDLTEYTYRIASCPLPGGVAAAATSAAMGAALISKAARVTLKREHAGALDRDSLVAALEAAETTRLGLLDLAAADTQAYRTLLERLHLPIGDPARRLAVAEASEIPNRVAATCQALLDRLQQIVGVCLPAVCPDVEIGVWMLELAVRAGALAEEENRKLEETA